MNECSFRVQTIPMVLRSLYTSRDSGDPVNLVVNTSNKVVKLDVAFQGIVMVCEAIDLNPNQLDETYLDSLTELYRDFFKELYVKSFDEREAIMTLINYLNGCIEEYATLALDIMSENPRWIHDERPQLALEMLTKKVLHRIEATDLCIRLPRK